MLLLGIVLGALGVHKAIDAARRRGIVTSLLKALSLRRPRADSQIVMGYQLHVSRALLRRC